MAQLITNSQDIVLRTPCNRVLGKDWVRLPKLTAEMIEVMKAEKGLGLAAPQIGELLRVVVLYDKTVMVNPEIVGRKGFKVLMPEGCLSIPGKSFLVSRFPEIKVTYKNLAGKTEFDRCVGTDAQLIQHELDHLDGKLICDLGTPYYK